MAIRALGVDLGGTNARAAVIDRDTGEILVARKESHRDRSPQAVVELVAGVVESAARADGQSVKSFGRLGVGVPGPCLGEAGIVLSAPNLGWQDVPFGSLLEERLGMPVRIANDLSAAAWGERRFGAAKGIDDVVLVFVGSGVGSGLIVGGRLCEGHRGVGGELGHVKVRPARPSTPIRRCGCGEMGCLEAYAGGMNISSRVQEELQGGVASIIGELVGGNLQQINPSVVDRACGAGDRYAQALWDEVSDALGMAVAAVATLLNPARILLGGGVMLACPELNRLVRQTIESRVARPSAVGLKVESPFLGDDAGVIGAALLE